MIKRINDPEDVVQILNLDDQLESILESCTKGEFIQFLIKNLNNENIFLLGYFDRGVLKAYMLAFNNVLLPISSVVFCTYFYSSVSDYDVSKALGEGLKQYSRNCGAKKIRFNCKKELIDYYEKMFECKQLDMITMELEL